MHADFMQALSKKRLLPIQACLLTVFLVSCGGGGGGGDNATTNDPLVVDNGNGVPADDIATSVLLRNAATKSSASLGTNITSMQRLGGSSSSLGLAIDAAPLDLLMSLTSDPLSDEPLTPDDVLATGIDKDILQFFDSMLGTDANLSEVTRTGNHITIDLDDAAFCEMELLDTAASAAEIADCQSLMSNVIIEIDAMSEESGLITITFGQESLMLIGYSPVTVNYELKLPGLQALLTQAAQLSDDMTTVPSMQGAIRVEATVTNDTENAEAGSFSIRVTERLNIVDNSGTNISLQPSTLLSVTADAATGTGSIEVGIAALNASLTSDDGIGGLSTSVLALAGLTVRMDVLNNGDTLQVSNLGLGNGPLTLSIDSVEQFRMILNTFGFTVNGETGTLTLSKDLAFEVSVAQLNTLSAQAPVGTAFSDQGNGTTLISQGGPLTASVMADSLVETISVGAGECFAANENNETALPWVNASCGL